MPEMVYEDELMLMKRFSPIVDKNIQKSDLLEHYNTRKEFERRVYYLTINIPKLQLSLKFRIRFLGEIVGVSIYNPSSGEIFYLIMQDKRRIEYLINVLKIKSEKLMHRAMLQMFRRVKQINGRNITCHLQTSDQARHAVISIQSEALKVHILKNSEGLESD